jgi:4-hydroxy-L-threonine phosphate dehydrogenase PdxA
MFGFLTPGTKETVDPLVSPKAVAAWLRQLPALMQSGHMQEALARFESVMKEAPDSAYIYYMRAYFLQAAGKPQPRLAVCGFNPHNGDNGNFGREEIEQIFRDSLGVKLRPAAK